MSDEMELSFLVFYCSCSDKNGQRMKCLREKKKKKEKRKKEERAGRKERDGEYSARYSASRSSAFTLFLGRIHLDTRLGIVLSVIISR